MLFDAVASIRSVGGVRRRAQVEQVRIGQAYAVAQRAQLDVVRLRYCPAREEKRDEKLLEFFARNAPRVYAIL